MTRFTDTASFRAALAQLPPPDAAVLQAAQERDRVLTKPAGALGRLETLAHWYCSWRGDSRARVASPQVVVFAGNHGVAARGVSAYPAAVTAQMVANFEAGGAAINQVAALLGARLDVVALDLETPTVDFTEAAAMDEAAFGAALSAGWDAVSTDADLLIPGEMGIGNTTAAAAISAALFGGSGADWVGRGTGVDADGLARKAAVVDAGLARHSAARRDALVALRCLGGREIAAMAGAMAAARVHRIPVVIDGFIATSAAACLARAIPGAMEHAVAGHRSAEAGHGRLLGALGLEPLLDIGMRLGEGSGAAVAALMLQAALACHSGMATFAEAGVAQG